jgi:DNA repair ATPase RecN
MSAELVLALIGAMFSLLAGGLTATEAIQKLIRLILRKEAPGKTYSERLSELTSSLTTASAQVDSVLRELSTVAREKEQAVKKFETGLGELGQREQELKKKIEDLQNVPLPVAEQFAKLVEPSERRGARRDYILFGAGVLVTTIITILLQAFAK